LHLGVGDDSADLPPRSFIRKLKKDLLSNSFGRRSRRDFWDSYVRGTQLGLITKDEDAGNRSEVTSKMAADVSPVRQHLLARLTQPRRSSSTCDLCTSANIVYHRHQLHSTDIATAAEPGSGRPLRSTTVPLQAAV
jgi:hypothetical protein